MLPFFNSNSNPPRSERFDALIVKNRHRLLASARKSADDMTDIDLLLSDTMKKVARVYFSRDMSDEALIRYAMRSLRNAAREAHQRNVRRGKAEHIYGQTEECYRQQQMTTTEHTGLHLELREVLRQLPQEEATILTMKVWEKQTFAEIAQRLGLTETTARRRYESAIQRAKNFVLSS